MSEKRFPYRRPRELDGGARQIHPVIIVGAGPVGLSAAIDLAMHDVRSIVLDDNDVVSTGSRAICWAKRTLEIFDRLGVGDRMVAQGVTWKVGRVYHRERELYSFDLLPEPGHKMPAFINLQQYHVEQHLIDRCADFPQHIDLRWKNKAVGLVQHDDHASLRVETPDGLYDLDSEWIIAADGARSPLRHMLGLAFDGVAFEEKFLIADIKTKADFPNERRFWFEPVFDRGESVLIHRQPDDVFRIDYQLGWNADAELERQPERVNARVRATIGDNVPFELEWCSVYSFRCAQLERFVHGSVIFAGDSAHVVSPFGARGGNGGIQDIDNLCWKLALVLQGRAPVTLIDSYNEERSHAAHENSLNSRRTTTFMTPKTKTERLLRDSVLALATDAPFARALVNGGRLSKPCSLEGFALQMPSAHSQHGLRNGQSAPDAPIVASDGQQWLLQKLGGSFIAMIFAQPSDATPTLPDGIVPLVITTEVEPAHPDCIADPSGLIAARYDAKPGTTLLIRPDQHVAARFESFDTANLAAAHHRAIGTAA